jgi:signal transduction histidine kinase/CHASE3 domain sensor protein
MYSRIPVRWQLRVLVGGIVGLMLLGVGATIAVLVSESHNITVLTTVVGPAREANSAILQAVTDAENALASYQVTGDPELLKQFADARERIRTAQDIVRERLVDPRIPEDDRFAYARLQALRDGALSALLYDADRAVSQIAAGARPDTAHGQLVADRFRTRQDQLTAKLVAERDQLRAASRDIVAEVTAVALASTAFGLLGSLLMARRTALSLTAPIDRLQALVLRNRADDPAGPADEPRGAREVRELATAFNELIARNNELAVDQANTIRLYELALRIERDLRDTKTTQDSFDVVCVGLGRGLGVDRLVVNVLSDDGVVTHGAHWRAEHLADFPPDVSPYSGVVATELWRRATHIAVADTREAPGDEDWSAAYRREANATAMLVVPIGIANRALGAISVLVEEVPRQWTAAEIAITHQIAAILAHWITEAEHRDRQARYVAGLENLDKQKDDFIATISHEIRTPLTSIYGFLEILLDGDEVTGQQRRMLTVIERNTSRLRGLIDDLLVMNRIGAGTLAMTTDTVPIGDLAEHAVEELRPLADKGDVRLELRHSDSASSGCVLGDPSYLHRAVVNVVANAIKFTPRGGQVHMDYAVDPTTDHVVLRCADSGIGIPRADLDQLATHFFRARNATAKDIPGTGLGLTIVKAIVDAHNGQLEITSEEGKGTTVMLRFPAVAGRPLMTGNT